MPETKYISSIKQNGEKYLIKDTEARTDIETIVDEQVHIKAKQAEEELVITFGPGAEYEQEGTNVTLTNAPKATQSRRTVII